MARYRRQPDKKDPYKAQPLPVERPVAVYYRQSTQAQIGNISTTLQTVDMVEHLVKLGWTPERIIMIDMDAGISGSKKINERPGMSQLFQMIEHQQVSAVAAQDIDRFFRDVTQIEPNIFIDACRRNNVLVLTPTMVFDFDHPTQGRYHMQMFRDQAQRAADYTDYQIRGRLLKSKDWMQDRGMWVGQRIAPGYMVDMREKVDGQPNPNYRKFVPFPLYAEIIRTYFELFQQYNGVQRDTVEHIWRHGPFYPEFTPELVPEGFYYENRNETRSPYTGKLCPAYSGFPRIMNNVLYLGHWTNGGAIVQWHNHEALVPTDLFMFAYNRVSPLDFYGEPNVEYRPHRPYTMHPKQERNEPEPIFNGFLFSDDLAGCPHRRVSHRWFANQQAYAYVLYQPDYKHACWSVRARLLDQILDQMLVERIRSTTLDEKMWAEALVDAKQGSYQEIQRLEHEIKAEKRTQDNIIASLGTLTHETMVHRAQAQFEASEQRVVMLEEQLQDLKSLRHRQQTFIQARPALQRLIEHWERVPREEKRNIFQDFAREIALTEIDKARKQVTIHWRDGSTTTQIVERITGRARMYNDPETQRLVDMINADVDQAEIMHAFPDRTWASLQKRYVRHSGLGRWRHEYAGKRLFRKEKRWNDLSEDEKVAAASDKRSRKHAPRLRSSILKRQFTIRTKNTGKWSKIMVESIGTVEALCA